MWGSDSGAQDQESHAIRTEPARTWEAGEEEKHVPCRGGAPFNERCLGASLAAEPRTPSGSQSTWELIVMHFSDHFIAIFRRWVSSALEVIEGGWDGPSSSDLEDPGCPRMANRVCAVHARDTQAGVARALARGKGWSRLWEVLGMCLITSLNLHKCTYAP